MKVAVFTPYSLLSHEAGVIYLLANYLADLYPESAVRQLKCNGAFSLCGHDAERGWKRNVTSCLYCAVGQQRLATWAGIDSEELAKYLMPQDVEDTLRWGSLLHDADLLTAQFGDRILYDYCKGSFKDRFGTETPDLDNKNHLRVLRRLLVSAARMFLAAERFCKAGSPEHVFVPSDSDFLTTVFLDCAALHGAITTVFKWDLHSRMMTLKASATDDEYTCSLLLEDVTSMRSDPCTWSEELLSVVNEILSFLKLSDTQLTLPLSNI